MWWSGCPYASVPAVDHRARGDERFSVGNAPPRRRAFLAWRDSRINRGGGKHPPRDRGGKPAADRSDKPKGERSKWKNPLAVRAPIAAPRRREGRFVRKQGEN